MPPRRHHDATTAGHERSADDVTTHDHDGRPYGRIIIMSARRATTTTTAGHVSSTITYRSWRDVCRPLHQVDLEIVADLHVTRAATALMAGPITHGFGSRVHALYMALRTRHALKKGK